MKFTHLLHNKRIVVIYTRRWSICRKRHEREGLARENAIQLEMKKKCQLFFVFTASRQRVMLETASIAGAVTIAVFLAVITFISVYIHCKRKQKELRTRWVTPYYNARLRLRHAIHNLHTHTRIHVWYSKEKGSEEEKRKKKRNGSARVRTRGRRNYRRATDGRARGERMNDREPTAKARARKWARILRVWLRVRGCMRIAAKRNRWCGDTTTHKLPLDYSLALREFGTFFSLWL